MENTNNPDISEQSERSSSDRVLLVEIQKLNEAIETLQTKHFYRYATHPLKLFGLAFLKGLLTGMGAIIGATALVALLVYLISSTGILPDAWADFLSRAIETASNSR